MTLCLEVSTVQIFYCCSGPFTTVSLLLLVEKGSLIRLDENFNANFKHCVLCTYTNLTVVNVIILVSYSTRLKCVYFVSLSEENNVTTCLQKQLISFILPLIFCTVMPSKGKTSACLTAETPRTSKPSSKTPSSKSQRTCFSPTAHKSKADHGSQQVLSSRSLPQFHAEILKLSPSCSHSVSLPQKGSDSSVLPEPTHSSHSLLESVSCPKLSQSPSVSLEIPSQFSSAVLQDAHCVPSHVIQNPPSPVNDELLFGKLL